MDTASYDFLCKDCQHWIIFYGTWPTTKKRNASTILLMSKCFCSSATIFDRAFRAFQMEYPVRMLVCISLPHIKYVLHCIAVSIWKANGELLLCILLLLFGDASFDILVGIVCFVEIFRSVKAPFFYKSW